MLATRRQINLPQLLVANPYPFEIPERMVWTSSSLKLFRKCKRKFFWKYMMRLRTLARDKNLLIGGGFHRCLGQWYMGRRSNMKLIAEQIALQLDSDAVLSQEFMDQKDFDDLLIALRTFRGMVEGYARVYEADRNEWRIERKLIEKKFLVNCGEFDYAGMIDLFYYTHGSHGNIVEHKTAAKIRSQYIERLPLDTQVRGYEFGATRAFGCKVNEVIYDVVQKPRIRKKSGENIDQFTKRIALEYAANPGRYFYREPLPLEQSDIDCFEYELHQTHKQYTAFTRGEYGDPKDPRSWEPNDGNCDEYFRLCPYFTLCTTGLDRSSCRLFQQGEHLHEELADDAD